jgi:PAS domain S-box-containing protein
MVSYLGFPISWPDGEIFGTICVLDNKRNEYSELYRKLLRQSRDVLQVDLRSLLASHRELEQRETKIRRLVDANIIGIIIWTLDGRVLEANDAFLGMLGYERADLVSGRVRWTDLTPAGWRDRDARAVNEVKTTGIVQPFEKEFFRKDGSPVPVLLGVAAFDDRREQGVAFVLDLTDRKHAQEALQNAQAELAHVTRLTTVGALTAAIAHEINQPIAATVANANAGMHWLAAQPPNLEEACQALGRIVRDGNRATEVMGRIRALVKKTPPRRERLDINQVVLEVISLTQGELQRNRVELQTQLAGNLPAVPGDRVQLQQIILNLILNAVEAMSELADSPRKLVVGSAASNSHDVLVEVRDSGPGLKTANLDRLFDSFYTTKPNGMGMGLAISRSIAEAHGGRLWATPNEPHGAVFCFTLPTDDRDMPDSSSSAIPDPLGQRRDRERLLQGH